MATLLIILLGTVLIQSSATVVGTDAPPHIHARGAFSQEFDHALFIVLTLTLATLSGFAIEHYWLAPRALGYLRTPLLALCSAAIFAGARRLTLHSSNAPQWRNFLPYVTNHCALFGLALFGAWHVRSLGEALGYGLGAALSLGVLNAAYEALRDRIANQDVPFVFRGIPIALITAGLMALALLGFTGLVRS